MIADVHGNLQALQAVLARLDAAGVADILCLGDLVGYNAGADACVELLHARRALAIAGNHDLIALGQLGFDRCAPRPEFSLRRTRRQLAGATRAHLARLPGERLVDGVALIHGGLGDATRYLHGAAEVADEAARLRARWSGVRLCLFGHTHAPAVWALGPGAAGVDRPRALATGPGQLLDREGLHLVNPGSVDAARRGDGHAEFAILDSDRWELAFHRVAYDHAAAEAQAQAAGYRMTRADEALLSARRLLRRARRKLGRRFKLGR